MEVGGAVVIIQWFDKDAPYQMGYTGVRLVPEFAGFFFAYFQVVIAFPLPGFHIVFFIQEAVRFRVNIAFQLAGKGKEIPVDKMGFLPGKEFLPPPVDKIPGGIGPP
jgi:hypothetical protein